MKSEQLPDGVPADELLQIYISAARDNLAAMNAALAQLESFPEGGWATLHRLSHNLKGSSLQFGFLETGELARALEGFASRRVQAAGAPGKAVPAEEEILRRALDELALLLDEIEQEKPAHDTALILERLQAEER